MLEWWITLGTAGQILACVAIFSTVLLVVQIIMLIFGLGASDGDVGDVAVGDVSVDGTDGVFGEELPAEDGGFSNADIDGGLKIFTFRGLVAFFTILGWSGIIFLKSGVSVPLSVLFGALLGGAAMFLMALFYKGMMKMQDNGNIDLRNAIGQSGDVYLAIPPSRSGKGKVNVTVQGRYSEYDAFTDSDTRLPTGSQVVVTGVSGDTLIVKNKK